MNKWLGQILGKQLSHPSGILGKWVGKLMNSGNKSMYKAAFDLMLISHGDNILEIGFGNGVFIPGIAEKIYPGKYVGIDISATMISSAQIYNQSLIQSGQVELIQTNVSQLPFENQSFDKVFTINTIYFWDHHQDVMKKLWNILKPQGSLLIALNTKEMMEGKSFTKANFQLFSREEIEAFFTDAGFTEIKSTISHSKTGDFLCIIGEKRV